MFTGITKTIEDRRPNEFIVMNDLWYLDNKPVFYKGEQAKITDVPDLPEFCMNSYCPLYRDVYVYEKKYYNIEQMSDDELVFCYIAKTLDSLGNFCDIAESAETKLASRILKIEKALKNASDFSEYKSFCLESSDDE